MTGWSALPTAWQRSKRVGKSERRSEFRPPTDRWESQLPPLEARQMPISPQTPEPGVPPIARSYYDASEPGDQKGALSGKPSSQSWIAGIPGFRSRVAWKAVVAVMGYLSIVFLILSGFGSPQNAVIGVSGLVVVFLVT